MTLDIISPEKVDESVYNFVDPAIAAVQKSRTGKDIANKEVRPDVYTAVWKNVSPAANWRSDKDPKKGVFEKYNPGPANDIKNEKKEEKVDEDDMKTANL